MNTDMIVQWATILSPIIAVLLAWWTSRSSTRAANKQIAAMKELQKIQLELSFIQTVKELNAANNQYMQISQRSRDESMRDSHFNQIGGPFELLRQREDRKRDMSDNQDFYAKQINELHNALSRIEALRKKIGGK